MTLEAQLTYPSLPPGAPGPRDALARALPEPESIAREEKELIAQGLEDLAGGLTYSHEHVKRLSAPDWRGLGCSGSTSRGGLRIDWTRAADMCHLGDPAGERRVHDALENFACTGFAQVYALPEDGLYRLHAGELRITLVVDAMKLTVVGIHRRERPSRAVPRR